MTSPPNQVFPKLPRGLQQSARGRGNGIKDRGSGGTKLRDQSIETEKRKRIGEREGDSRQPTELPTRQ